eukprot:TRINITY_DN4057_c0_g1_i2.p1 TRINITY_DN4057_c0_g1~~TRINITY_DN4057_c0_g1_i2.p1  ORF type:complete len:486 (+),score=125.87 TRINITY_DN4057_c0_g1_i2:533-1990(+)
MSLMQTTQRHHVCRLPALSEVFEGPCSHEISGVFPFPAKCAVEERLLRASLARTVCHRRGFWPLCGRLVGTRRVEWDEPPAGASPVEREAVLLKQIDYRVQHLHKAPPALTEDATPEIVDLVNTREGLPLLRVVVTYYDDGTMLLGVSVSHCLVDGYAFFYFLACWGREARHAYWPTPVVDQMLMLPTNVATPRTRADPSTEMHEAARLCGASFLGMDKTRHELDASEIQTVLLPFRKEQMDALLVEAGGNSRTHAKRTGFLLGALLSLLALLQVASPWTALRMFFGYLLFLLTPDPSAGRISFNDALSARIWRGVVCSSTDVIKDDDTVTLRMPCDVRRLVPKLGPSFVGNAVMMLWLEARAGDIRHETLADTARRLRKRVDAYNATEFDAAMTAIERARAGATSPDIMQHLDVCSHRATSLLVTNVSRVPLRELDFGRGCPIHLHSPPYLVSFPAAGVFPDVNQPGGVIVFLYLPKHYRLTFA